MELFDNMKVRTKFGTKNWSFYFFIHELIVFKGIHICFAGGLTQKSNKKGQVLPNEYKNYLPQSGKNKCWPDNYRYQPVFSTLFSRNFQVFFLDGQSINELFISDYLFHRMGLTAKLGVGTSGLSEEQGCQLNIKNKNS